MGLIDKEILKRISHNKDHDRQFWYEQIKNFPTMNLPYLGAIYDHPEKAIENPRKGDVVLYGSKEYLYDGTKWIMVFSINTK